jgi:two-component system, NtrC family, sensor kinase
LLCTQPSSPQTRRDLERIDEAAERCRRIVQNLLTFARRHGSEMAMCDINDTLEATLSLQEYQFRVDNIEVVRDLQPNLPWTLADRYQLQQVFFNIIANALHAMREVQGGVLRVSSRSVDGHIKVSISDTGRGMTPEVLARVFEPFFTTKEVGEGTGLGLSICYGIVQEHQGRITVDSQLGQGATFVIDLPRRKLEMQMPPAASPCADNGAHKGARILVVDDEESILNLVQRALASEGFLVDAARTGLEALKFLDAVGGQNYGLVLSDVKMPGLDGPRLYAHLKYNRPGLEKRVVFMTGDTSSYETNNFLESAQVIYISKPFGLEALRDLVNKNLTMPLA